MSRVSRDTPPSTPFAQAVLSVGARACAMECIKRGCYRVVTWKEGLRYERGRYREMMTQEYCMSGAVLATATVIQASS